MQDFARKRDALFASLDDASKDLIGTALDQSGNDCSAINIFKENGTGDADFDNRPRIVRRNSHSALLSTNKSLSRLRGKESIFKKPELPISKCLKPRKTPDYQMNPHKWKKYTLSDVDISEQTNNRAAFAFLAAIDEHRETQAALGDNAVNSKNTKIEFNKLSIIKRQMMTQSDELADEEVDRPQLKGSKFVMPQYVVGQRFIKKRKQGTASALKKRNTNTERQLNLSHLLDYDDE